MQSGTTGSFGGSSLSVLGALSSYDVQKESDVIALLKLIHQNQLGVDIQNQLRDLVFAYRQDLSSAAHAALQEACALIGVTIAPQSPKVVPQPQASAVAQKQTFSVGRPIPRFLSPSAPTQTAPTVETAHRVPVHTTASMSQTEASPSSVQGVEPVAVEDTPSPVAVPPLAPRPEVPSVSATERIAFIKKSIHEKVGNPVNLIETHKDLGRAYMNALLDAMKKSSGAPQGELETAMGKLEAAYSAVVAAVDGTPAPAPQAAPIVERPTVAEIPKVAPEQQVVTTSASFVPPQPSVKVPVVDEDVTAERVRAIQEKLAQLKERVAEGNFVAPKIEPAQPHDTPAHNEAPRQPVAPQVRLQREVTAQAAPRLQSVAKSKQLEDLMRSKKTEEVIKKEEEQKNAEALLDPLHTTEVSAGLNQLLSEWPLFRSSGFFGTGPSGKDHALYQKISQLTMASVVAGRFEGATPLIKQSIADYMNGWRYEEGIVHEHGETFEHYLRKVVAHIIAKKKIALTR